eukprot:Hpha_TRINITY_DN15868_c2_g8::TRINITY_DN15868_c2_g8_i1::g.192126::m.192126
MSLAERTAAAKKGLEKKKTYGSSITELVGLLDEPRADGDSACLAAAIARAQAVYLARYDDEATWEAVAGLVKKAAASLQGKEGEDVAKLEDQLTAARPSSDPKPAAASGGYDMAAGIRPPPAMTGAELARADHDFILRLLTGGVNPEEELPQELLERIASLESNQTPAAREAWHDLLVKRIPHDAQPGDFTCCVCQDDLEPRRLAKRMPCEHLFHDQCLGEWLEKSNTCPLCRYELPTEKIRAMERKKAGTAGLAKTDAGRLYS